MPAMRKRRARLDRGPGSPADPAADAPPATPCSGFELRDRVQHCVPVGALTGVIVELDKGARLRAAKARATRSAISRGTVRLPTTLSARRSAMRRAGSAAPDFAGKRATRQPKRGARVHAQLASNRNDRSVDHWLGPGDGDSVEQCFATESEPKAVRDRRTIDFDAAGIATRAQLATSLPLDKCIAAALKTLRAPCPRPRRRRTATSWSRLTSPSLYDD